MNKKRLEGLVGNSSLFLHPSSFQKLLDPRHDPFMSILHDVVSRVGHFMHDGLWKELRAKAFEEMRRKAPVPHAPDEHDGVLAELKQAGLDIRERPVARMLRLQGDIQNETMRSDAM